MDGKISYQDPSVKCGSCEKFYNECGETDPESQVNDCSDYKEKLRIGSSGYLDEKKPDMVNHPFHYAQGGIECIKAIEASMEPKGFQDYCKGNVMKYIWRWRDKAGVEDLKKAQVYLNWLIESAQKEEN